MLKVRATAVCSGGVAKIYNIQYTIYNDTTIKTGRQTTKITVANNSSFWGKNDENKTADLTPMLAMRLVSSAMPPARSLTVTTNRHSRPSAARPRSRHRPSTVVSMLPPHNGITTLHSVTHGSSFTS